jgi:regulator of sirC expression with transglutaminase-like and TPR domain
VSIIVVRAGKIDRMEDPKETRKAFAALLALPDDAIDLAHASLLIAREEYPDLDVGLYLARLDGMANEITRRMRGREGATSLIAHLNRLLFEEMGFRGNREDYYDPRNSFLNDVLDRRIGIPITLSTVYLEVGRRIGCRLAGVAFPGHFMVRLTGQDRMPDVLIDPFNRGRILTEADCQALLIEMYGGQVPFRPELLKRARTPEILQRMINNLKWIYQQRRDYHMALRAQQLLLCIDPERPEEIRDRGLIQFRLALIAESVADLERYLALSPGAPDAPQIEKRLKELRRLVPRMN